MVKTLLSLRLRIAKNMLFRSPMAMIGTFFGLLYLGAIYVGAVGFIVAGAGFLEESGYQMLVGVAAILMAAMWLLLPLFFTGMDGTIEPRSLVTWVPPSKKLARALIMVTALDASGIGSLIIALCIAIGWFIQGHALWGVLNLILAPLAWLLWVYSARVATSYFSRIATRKTRERMFVLFVVLIMAIAVAPQMMSAMLSSDGDASSSISLSFSEASASISHTVWVIASVIPTAWPIAAPLSFAQGHLIVGIGQIVGSVALLWGLNTVWARQLVLVMTSPQNSVSKHSAYAEGTSDLVWADRLNRHLPAPVAAIAARSLRYWRNDPRYLTQFIAVMVVALMPVFGVYMGARGSDAAQDMGAFPLVIACGLAGIFMGVSLVNDIGMDSTAVWTHISAGVRGRDDRLGRLVGAAIWQIPLLFVISVGISVIFKNAEGMAVGLGVGLAAWGGSMATASVMSALVPTETHAPGESMMKSKTSSNAFFGALLQILTMGTNFILLAPVVIYWVLSQFVVDVLPPLTVLPVGIAWGALLLWAGITWGGKVYNQRIVRNLSRISSWDQAKV
ncbi:hypothetical protein [Actinomyces vulturis]|uniref:hypothetical protein n=1 Tax=Actinomyces vulturis TaxID=1857645 RepID=UPI000835AC74|nr:hypothetical protein [Actinomyces vulturis]